MKHHLLALALAAGCSFHVQAIEPGKSQTLTSPDQVPEGLSAADWSSIRSAYSAGHTAKAAGVFSQQAYLKASNTGEYNFFGFSVTVSGDTVVVGANREDSNALGEDYGAYGSGAVYVFIRSGGIWTQQAYLKASNTDEDDQFGTSVAVSGDTIVVGASEEDSSTIGVNSVPNETGSGSGAAYVFTRSGSTWTQQAYLKASNTDEDDELDEDSGYGDNFGASVAVSGDTIVVGASGEDSDAVGVNGDQEDNSESYSGAAYVFKRSGVTWSQQAYLKGSNTEWYNYFGTSVAISGETIVVGASGESSSTTGVGSVPNEAAYDSGAAYVFTRSGVMWTQQAYLKASNTGERDSFGTSVAVSGETIVVGANNESSSTTGVGSSSNEAASGSGAAYVFTRSGVMWSQQAYLKASNTGRDDSFGTSVAVSGETVVVGANYERSNAVGVNGNQADNNATGSGAAYVFTRSASTWSQQAYLKASNSGVNDYFGYSVAVSGSTIVSGAGGEDSITSGINTTPDDTGDVDADHYGAAYIYTLSAPEPPPAVVKYLVSVKVSNSKLGKVTGIGSFDIGSTVTLSARAKKGHKFAGWYEKKKLVTKKKVLVIKNLTANRSLVAKFK